MRANWQDPGPPPTGGGLQLAMPPMTPVVKRLMLANVAVFLGCYLLDFVDGAWLTVIDLFGIQPALWKEWFPLLPVWQLVSWGFLHSVYDPFHILKNMLFLYFLGTMLEGITGGRRFFAFYVSALLVSGLATLMLGLVSGSDVPTLGASGAVLGVVVATAVLRPTTRVIFILFPITLKTLAILFVGLDLFFFLGSLKGTHASNVAYAAHLAGAVWGFLAARQGWIWRDPVASIEAWRDRRDDDRREDDARRLDDLLEKINSEGIHSLSTTERAFLKRASKRR